MNTLTVRSRCALAVVAFAFPPLVGAVPPAFAQPGCDWNTDTGTQACMGGGPFDAGKNGNGDTYGPSGEAGFLADNRPFFPNSNDKGLLTYGYSICRGIANGQSEASFEAELTSHGVSEVNAGAFVMSAQMFLCPVS